MEMMHLLLMLLIPKVSLLSKGSTMPVLLHELLIRDMGNNISYSTNSTTSTEISSTAASIDRRISVDEPAVIAMICLFLVYWIFALSIIAYLIYVFCYDLVDLDALNKNIRQEFALPLPPDTNMSHEEVVTPVSKKKPK